MSTRDTLTTAIPDDEGQRIGTILVHWFTRTARDLPWRRMRHDPYAVWVSEIMLQQPQVRTVEPYYARWMARFPTIAALAAADTDEVLRYWEGLGYYGRARRLHMAARVVMQRHGGVLPRDIHLLRALPGIGSYTAAAITAIAYNQPNVALDANARRVLQRISAAAEPDRRITERALTMMPDGRAGDFTQALFELGARICTAERARCGECPIENLCLGRRSGNPMAFGRRAQRPTVIRVTRAAAVVTHADTVLVVRRYPEAVWGGLWEFPWLDAAEGDDLTGVAQRAAREIADVAATMSTILGSVRHSVTRYRVELFAVLGTAPLPHSVPVGCCETAWVGWDQITSLPMPSPQRRLTELAMQQCLAQTANAGKENAMNSEKDQTSQGAGGQT